MRQPDRRPRLACPDPFAEVRAARAERGALVARRLVRGLRRRSPAAPARTAAAAPGSALLAMAPLAAGYFLSYLFRNVNGVIAGDIMRDLGVGADLLGALTSAYFLAFAAAQLPVGVLLDRYGPRLVQAGLFLCAAAGAALCALDAGIAVLFAGRALIGLGTAGALVSGLKASAQWIPPQRQPLANGLFIMFGGLGALGATWPAEYLGALVGWRGLSAVLAAAAAAVALAVWAMVPRGEDRRRPAPAAAGLAEVFRDPLFRRFAPLSASCFGAVLAVQGLWAGPFLADVHGLTRKEVAGGLALMAAVLILAAPAWGLVTQALRRRMRLTRLAALAAVLLIAAETLVLVPFGVPPLAPWCLFAAFGGMTVLSYSVMAEHFPAAAIGRANGALNVLHIGVSFALQLGIGQVVARWAPEGGRYPAAAYQAGLLLPLALQAAALVWFLWPRRRPVLVATPASGD